FGSAQPSETQDNEIVCIPGLRGREPKEISVKNLASIINARMTEIIELVDYEIINSGLKNKLIAGIVVTGGGAQLKHLKQLFEYITCLDTRIGLPTEHLANTNDLQKFASPIYSTGIGLVMTGFKDLDRKGKLSDMASKNQDQEAEKTTKQQSVKKRIGFFESLVEKSKNWFIEEE